MICKIHFMLWISLCVLLCGRWDAAATGSDEEEVHSADVKVILRPPQNITFFMNGSTEVFLGWAPPEIYTPHDVNTTLIDPPLNESYYWQNNEVSQATSTDHTTNSVSEQVGSNSADVSTHASSTLAKTDNIPAPTVYYEEKCQPLKYFFNNTVDFNASEIEDGYPSFITMKEIYQKEYVTTFDPSEVVVDFARGCVKEYLVVYFTNSSDVTTVRVNASDRPEVLLTNLSSSTDYSLYIAAVFVSDNIINSTTISFKTLETSQKRRCVCDWHGSVYPKNNGGSPSCSDNITQPCTCREGYWGLYCERCSPGFYRTAPYFPCHRCPCSLHSSRDPTCHFREGFLTCTNCEVGYVGNICHMCDYGYYRFHKYCVLCRCNGNEDPKSRQMCNAVTGACENCIYNTTGMNCERCKEGYIGDPFTYKNCTLAAHAISSPFQVLPQGVIAAICVGVILLLCVVVGFIMYVRWSKYPQNRPFWTVELKDNHEGVNFNTVPGVEDEVQVIDPRMTMDDMDFYENQGGAAQSRSGGGAGSKYARLQENV